MNDDTEIEDIYPVTPLQHGMLFHSLADPASGVYVEQFWCTLRGPLDAGMFRAAWEHVIGRHAVLRTSFLFKEVDEPAQIVHRAAAVPLTVTDWEGRSDEEQERFLSTVLHNDAARGFDSDVAPLMRLMLFRCSSCRHRLVWSFHHALLDGWSVPLVLGEVFISYASLVRGSVPSLPSPPLYRDYVVWLHRQDRTEAERFWRTYLAGIHGPTTIPVRKTDRVPGMSCSAPREHEVWLDPAVTTELLAAAKAHHLTPATLLHAAWALVLCRFSSSNDVVFGSTIAGRPHTLHDAAHMVGLFINTVPVRLTVDRRMPLLPWLLRVQSTLAAVRDHGYCGLDQVQRWSDVPAGTPLFDTLVVFENYPVMPVQGSAPGEIAVDGIHSTESTHLPLTIVGGCSDRFMIRLLPDANVFDAGPVEQMLVDLTAVLSAFRDPGGSVRSVFATLAGTGDRGFLRGEVVPWKYRSILDLIGEHARKNPDASAVESAAGSLSYGELDRRANRLARYLVSQGIGPEQSVGILVGPSPERIIAVLAVLKSGAAYLPLDPRSPTDRLGFILEETRTSLVLLDSFRNLNLVPAGQAVVSLGDLVDRLRVLPDLPLPQNVDPSGIAYTIYTSGSTGKPKGIQVHHEALVNLALAYCERFGLDSSTRHLQFFSFGFDGSVGDIFSTLAAGGTLILPDPVILSSIPDLQSFLAAYRVNTVMMTPTMLSVLDGAGSGAVRTIIAGGEQCHGATAARWVGRCSFHNAYGPTETTVAATTYRVGPDVPHAGPLPIGRPIPNTRAYILDADLDPVPPGVPGELFIAGRGVARGYCGRPGLTASVFVPDPFSETPGERMYRTGDRVRLLPDGNLLFVERVDLQIKVRGYRIEPGEIEAVLREDPAVADAAVLCRNDGDGGEYLVAYVIGRTGAPVDPDALSAACARTLPAYMLPSRFVVMETFPLTANGKVDRAALPVPGRDVERRDAACVGARTSTERALVAIWEKVLQRRPIGVRDDFFVLGGHSLLALRLLGEVEKHFGRSFPLLTFFQHPTIEVLGELIDSAAPAVSGSPLVELRRGGDEPPLFLVHPTGGSVHWYVDLVHEFSHPRPVFGLQAAGLNADEDPDASIEEMVARYAAAIRSQYAPGPVFVAGWSLGVIVAYALAVHLLRTGYEVLMLGVLDQGPEPPVRRDPVDSAELLEDIFGEPLNIDAGFLRTMADEERYLYVLRLARKKGLVPITLRKKQFMRYLRLNQLEGHAWRAYRPEFYPGTITLFRSHETVNEAHMVTGWHALARDGVNVVDVPGDHLSMMRPPHVRVLAARLDEAMTIALNQWKGTACPATPIS